LIDLVHAGPTTAAAFAASAVEAVEAATIVLAAGLERGWRSSLAGAFAALVALAAIVMVFGSAIAAIPIDILQLVVGVLLLLFGIRWLRKAMLRSAGVIGLRDEEMLFASQRSAFNMDAKARQGAWDAMGLLVSFKAVALEGLEVVVIVIGIGAAGGALAPATAGAIAACAVVAISAALMHRPLSRVPENSLKYAVGIMVSAFGLFWFGEGIGAHWPFGDATILGLMAILLVASWVAVGSIRRGMA
jgi:uncharacterized membrane protein